MTTAKSFSTSRIIVLVILFMLVAVSILLAWNYRESQVIKPEFNGQRAFSDVEYQVNLGPRTPGSPAHAQAVDWIQAELQAEG